MKQILVTGRLTCDDQTGEVRDTLDSKWTPFLQQAGLLPILVPHTADLDTFLAHLSYDGLLLTGGNDLGLFSNCSLSKARDAFELDLLARVEMPVLGVCRGMQLLGQRYGATLQEVDGHVAARHLVGGREVNSYHRYAMTSAGKLTVCGRSPDGVIEHIAHPTKPIVGIMWHPERESPFCQEDLSLFRRHFGGA